MAEVFIPLNRFQSVVAQLTGEEDQIYTTPQGVSTIVLSAQITNNSVTNQPVTIFVTSNAELPAPSFEKIWDGSNFISESVSLNNYSSSFVSASSLISLNRQFIRKEAAAYINFLNNQTEIPFSFTSSRFEQYALGAADATSYDIKNKTVIRTTKEAKSYFTKNGVNIIKTRYPEEYSSSLFTLDYVKTLAGQILKNQSVTGSASVQRLYQNLVTQSFDFNYTITGENYSSSIFVVNNLIDIIKETIETPILVAQPPIQLVKNAIIPPADSLSPVVAGKLVLEETYGFVISGSNECSVILSLLESANE